MQKNDCNLPRHVLLALFVCVVADCLALAGDDLPNVPDGFQVTVFASEPLVRNPCAMAFDWKGRLFVSQGPQYRSPKPDTPGDRISILIDDDNDGVADRAKTFADGLNHIQGMAWRGNDLWVANAPELTIVRDTDGDDEADEYVLVYGGLGNIEHALHGLNHAPDGRVYMTKGNSKGFMDANSSELYVAPKAFADLWGMELPDGAPEIPKPIVFKRDEYRRGYHYPSDDWGTEGGVLRCDPDGKNLEIVSRGMRNPWDMAYDEHFNWLLTDQDQDGGDRILSPFPSAHFGWGHPWSAHWTGENHLPSMTMAGPVFHGSGTGVVYGVPPLFPEKYRNVFFAADWLNRSIFVFRPQWDGSRLRNMDKPEVFAAAPKGRSLGSSSGMVFEPTDIEFGPDGTLWVLSWGHGYGATIKDGEQVDAGRVYRIAPPAGPLTITGKPIPFDRLSTRTLVNDYLRHEALPAKRIAAANELIRRARRNSPQTAEVVGALSRERARAVDAKTGRMFFTDPPGAVTWRWWTLARIAPRDESITQFFTRIPEWSTVSDHVTALRILGYRCGKTGRPLPDVVHERLTDKEPRIRFAAVQAIREARDITCADELWSLAGTESDRGVFYATWQTLRKLASTSDVQSRLSDEQPGVRRAALLALLEDGKLSGDDVVPLRLDVDRDVAELASRFVELVGTKAKPVIEIAVAEKGDDGAVSIRFDMIELPGTHVRFTLSGSDPSDTNAKKYAGPFRLEPGGEVRAALFQGRSRLGPVVKATWEKLSGVSPQPKMDLPPLAAVEVSKIQPATRSPHRTAILQRGTLAYTDREYRFISVPESLIGATTIQTSNNDIDVGSTGNRFLSFRIAEPATVYVGHDRRVRERPAWLNDFERTGLTLKSDDSNFDLFMRQFAAGDVVLGGNTVDGNPGGKSQYVVAIAPLPVTLKPLSEPTGIADVLDRMESAHPGRGARLFYGPATCSRCHRLGSRGNAFAPNLTKLGKRADAKTIAESVLKPNAVIMEGFHTLVVLTKDGKSYSGFIKQESGLKLDLVQADGKLISIPKSNIELRRRQDKSAMPDGLSKLLTPQHVADLAAFIVAYNEPKASTEVDGSPSRHPLPGHDSESRATLKQLRAGQTWGTASSDFHLKTTDGAVDIRLDGQPIASFVYRHDKVRRPFFAHVKTTGGIQVTRNYPPVEGKDTTDHPHMHPGIWLAFARLNDISFWHNSGAEVVHEGFVDDLSAGESAAFTTVDRYVAPGNDTLCRQTTRYRLTKAGTDWLLDIDAKFSSDKPFWFGVREEMGLGVRVATPVRVRDGNGSIVNSTGDRNEKGTWGKVANWWNYSGTIDDRHVGIMLMSAPGNPDVWSHSRDYGVLVANPFPVDRPPNRSHRTAVEPGQSFRLRFGVLIHESAETRFFPASAWTKYKQVK